MKHLFLAAVAAIVLPVNALAGNPKQAAKGDLIPDIIVKTADASELKLREAVKSKPTVLIFYRGGWCPYCSRQLMALASVEKDLSAAGFQILAVSADKPATLAETPNLEKLTCTLLSDASMDAAKAFGITFKVPEELVSIYKTEYQIDLEAASGSTHHLLPHPAVFILDQEGIIRFAHVNPDYKTRIDPAEILKVARESALPIKPAASQP